jgi:hypothetical protein
VQTAQCKFCPTSCVYVNVHVTSLIRTSVEIEDWEAIIIWNVQPH